MTSAQAHDRFGRAALGEESDEGATLLNSEALGRIVARGSVSDSLGNFRGGINDGRRSDWSCRESFMDRIRAAKGDSRLVFDEPYLPREATGEESS